MSRPRILIAGCGYLGLATARLFHRGGWEVTGWTHSADSAGALSREPFPVHACDLTDIESVRRFQELRGIDAIIHCASSGRGGADAYRRVYLNGVRHLAEALAPGVLLFTSSTSVYGQTSGEWVTEESAAAPAAETGRILREAEDFVRSRNGIAARLAGLYGPTRSVPLRKFFAGEAVIEGDGSRWINQIHRDDAASALLTLVTQRVSGTFNVSDDAPLSQRALYEWLANRFQRPIPPSGPVETSRKRGWTHKRVSNEKLKAFGWKPIYGTFFEAIERDRELTEGLVS